jgi:hypothetical protein
VCSGIRGRFIEANTQNRTVRVSTKLQAYLNGTAITAVYRLRRNRRAPDITGTGLWHDRESNAMGRLKIAAIIDRSSHERYGSDL